MIQDFLWNWIPYLMNKTTDIVLLFKRVATVAMNEATLPKKWYILYGNPSVPIYSSLFPNIDMKSDVHWSCTTNPVTFTHTSSTSGKYKHISYLGFIVHIPGQDSIDLTEWLNTVRWSGITQPSLYDIFMMWSCETGTPYFHRMDSIKVELITELGECVTKGLNESALYPYSVDDKPGYSKTDRLNTDRIMDAVFSSSGC